MGQVVGVVILLLVVAVAIAATVWYQRVVKPVVERADAREDARLRTAATEDDLKILKQNLILQSWEVSRSASAREPWIDYCRVYLSAQERLGLPIGDDLEQALHRMVDFWPQDQMHNATSRENLKGVHMAIIILEQLRQEV